MDYTVFMFLIANPVHEPRVSWYGLSQPPYRHDLLIVVFLLKWHLDPACHRLGKLVRSTAAHGQQTPQEGEAGFDEEQVIVYMEHRERERRTHHQPSQERTMSRSPFRLKELPKLKNHRIRGEIMSEVCQPRTSS
jgi:hypothetical protein